MIKWRLNRHWNFTTCNSNVPVIQNILIAESRISNSIQKKVKWDIFYWDNSIRCLNMSIVCVFIFINIHQRRYFPKVFEPVMYNHPMVFFSRPFGNKVRSKSSVIALCSAIPNSNIYIYQCIQNVFYIMLAIHTYITFGLFPLTTIQRKKSGSLILL